MNSTLKLKDDQPCLFKKVSFLTRLNKTKDLLDVRFDLNQLPVSKVFVAPL